MMYDVAIIGGSSAGLSAALVLGRAMRRVLLFDDGRPCNRFSHASHGFLTRDGVTPAALVQTAREQLSPYQTVQTEQATVTAITPNGNGYSVETSAGMRYHARKILLATGIEDILPPLPGIDAFWGRSVLHCPYCDGWEVRNQPLAVFADTKTAHHQVMLIQHWSPDLTLLTGGAAVLSDAERAVLTRRGIRIVETPVVALEGEGCQLERIRLEDGQAVVCRALFVRPAMRHRTPFAHELGCTLTEAGYIQIDLLGRTSVRGVYAAGDIASPLRSVAMAVAQGSSAGAGINYDLIAEAFT